MNTLAPVNTGKNVMEFSFAIGQRVYVEAIRTNGIVKAIIVTKEGIEYQVAYFDDEKRRQQEWLADCEISRITG